VLGNNTVFVDLFVEESGLSLAVAALDEDVVR